MTPEERDAAINAQDEEEVLMEVDSENQNNINPDEDTSLKEQPESVDLLKKKCQILQENIDKIQKLSKFDTDLVKVLADLKDFQMLVEKAKKRVQPLENASEQLNDAADVLNSSIKDVSTKITEDITRQFLEASKKAVDVGNNNLLLLQKETADWNKKLFKKQKDSLSLIKIMAICAIFSPIICLAGWIYIVWMFL